MALLLTKLMKKKFLKNAIRTRHVERANQIMYRSTIRAVVFLLHFYLFVLFILVAINIYIYIYIYIYIIMYIVFYKMAMYLLIGNAISQRVLLFVGSHELYFKSLLAYQATASARMLNGVGT